MRERGFSFQLSPHKARDDIGKLCRNSPFNAAPTRWIEAPVTSIIDIEIESV
jgi:hypothetical protein